MTATTKRRITLWCLWLINWPLMVVAITACLWAMLTNLFHGSWWWLFNMALLFWNIWNLTQLLRVGPPWQRPYQGIVKYLEASHVNQE